MRDDVLDAVLAVGVERGEHRGAGLAAGVLDAGLDGRALAEVDRVAARRGRRPRSATSAVSSRLPSSTHTTWSKTERRSAMTSPMTLASLKAGTMIQTSW